MPESRLSGALPVLVDLYPSRYVVVSLQDAVAREYGANQGSRYAMISQIRHEVKIDKPYLGVWGQGNPVKGRKVSDPQVLIQPHEKAFTKFS